MGETLEVAPGVHWLRMPLPFALDHINLWLLEDGDDWVIVDTGYPSSKTKTAWETILRDRKVNRIIVTHFHPDHVGLAGWLEQYCDAPVLMTAKEFDTARLLVEMSDEAFVKDMEAFFLRHGLNDERLEVLMSEGNSYATSVWELHKTYQRLAHGQELTINGRPWRIVVGEGHAPEQAALYCEELKVLIAGDMILPEITPNISTEFFDPSANPLKDYLESLDRFETLASQTLVLPSHRLPFQGLKARIAQLRAHHQERLERCCRALAGGPKTANDMLDPLFERRLDSFGVYFAMGEAMAHLDYLVGKGEIKRQDGEIVRYSL